MTVKHLMIIAFMMFITSCSMRPVDPMKDPNVYCGPFLECEENYGT